MPVYVSWILVFVLKNHHVRGDVPPKDPDFDKNVSELIVSKGYPVEEHSVTTPDGYILGVQRIPYGRDGRHGGRDSVRPAVLVMHGLLNSAADWVINFQNQSFGFILADAGYDVWLGNVRGNTYARQHATLDVKSNKYWDFSFDQMIEFDLPTTIDMVLGTTHQPMLYYAGYSQGALIMFGLLSAKPEYNTKVALFAALAPVTALGHIKGPARKLAPLAHSIKAAADTMGIREFSPNSEFFKKMAGTACSSATTSQACINAFFSFIGPETAMTNRSRFPVILAHMPAGTSVKNMVHFGQLINNNRFCMFSYGRNENSRVYGTGRPPCYELENVRVPVAIFWGDGDWMSTTKDLDNLKDRLSNVVYDHRVDFPNFNHIDFIFASGAKTLLYDKVIQVFRKFQTRQVRNE